MSAEVHERLAVLALGGTAGTVVDLGSGQGRTLVEVARRSPESLLTAVDLDVEKLALLAARLPQATALRHDLSDPLPFGDSSVDIAISYNTLECLPNPAALLVEVARVLRPEGRLVAGHTDFETIVVTAANRDLARRVLLTYTQMPVPYRYMAAVDAQMGRRLPGLVRRSPLRLESVEAHTTVVSSLSEAEALRLAEVASAVRRSAERGLGHVTVAEIDEWIGQLQFAETSGDFLFSETAFLVTAVRSG